MKYIIANFFSSLVRYTLDQHPLRSTYKNLIKYSFYKKLVPFPLKIGMRCTKTVPTQTKSADSLNEHTDRKRG